DNLMNVNSGGQKWIDTAVLVPNQRAPEGKTIWVTADKRVFAIYDAANPDILTVRTRYYDDYAAEVKKKEADQLTRGFLVVASWALQGNLSYRAEVPSWLKRYRRRLSD